MSKITKQTLRHTCMQCQKYKKQLLQRRGLEPLAPSNVGCPPCRRQPRLHRAVPPYSHQTVRSAYPLVPCHGYRLGNAIIDPSHTISHALSLLKITGANQELSANDAGSGVRQKSGYPAVSSVTSRTVTNLSIQLSAHGADAGSSTGVPL